MGLKCIEQDLRLFGPFAISPKPTGKNAAAMHKPLFVAGTSNLLEEWRGRGRIWKAVKLCILGRVLT